MKPPLKAFTSPSADGITASTLDAPSSAGRLGSPSSSPSVISLHQPSGGLVRRFWDWLPTKSSLLFFGGALIGALLMWISQQGESEYVRLNDSEIVVRQTELGRLAILYAGPQPTEDAYAARCDVFDEDGNFLGIEIHWKRIVTDDTGETQETKKISSRVVRIGGQLGNQSRRYRD